MVKAKTIKKRIKLKFGTISRFAEIAGRNEYQLRLLLANWSNPNTDPARAADIDLLLGEVKQLKDKDIDSKEITDNDRTFIASMIKKYYTTVQLFCWFHAQFTEPSIYQILCGIRKRKTKMVKEIIKVLKEKNAE